MAKNRFRQLDPYTCLTCFKIAVRADCICTLESRVQEVVELVPQSLRIPRSHLKMSNTIVGQGKS